MAATVSQTSKYVPGGDQVRRFQLTGDTSYPTGGYPVLALIRALATMGGLVEKRILSIRHRTLASAILGCPIGVDTYAGGTLSALNLVMVNPAGTAEVANGTSMANLNVEIVCEGY